MHKNICEPLGPYQKDFSLARLSVSGLDNLPVLAANDPWMANEEVCLLHDSVASGDAYLDFFHALLRKRLREKKPFPVVRFADGEYAFYDLSLMCNGLYRQARSVADIEQALPLHRKSLQRLAGCGLLAPLIHQGNVRKPQNVFARLIRKKKGDDSACRFLRFLAESGVTLTADNYLPFYCVYAYLSSKRFAALLDGRHLCLVSSEVNKDACLKWFSERGSSPAISFVPVPESYLATQWPDLKERILSQVPDDVDFCLVGAGIGALPVCVDLAWEKSLPVVDAGHVLNMMNGRVDKSNGARLYTLWQK